MKIKKIVRLIELKIKDNDAMDKGICINSFLIGKGIKAWHHRSFGRNLLKIANGLEETYGYEKIQRMSRELKYALMKPERSSYKDEEAYLRDLDWWKYNRKTYFW